MRRTLRGLLMLTVWLAGTVALAQGAVTVTSVREPAPACPWLARSDNCWAQALAEFDECAPPQGVRGTLYVDGICRYYDGTFLRSEVLQDPPEVTPLESRFHELKFELTKVGKSCFSFRRRLSSGGAVDLGPKPWPKEIETEIETRHGRVRYVQSWDVDRQIELWNEYQRAQHPPGTEVLPREPGSTGSKPSDRRPKPLDTYAFGEKSVGFLTCPDRSMVIIGFKEYMECDTALPVRALHAVADEHALEFAFVQQQWTKKSLACGVHNPKAEVHPYFNQQVYFQAPVPAIPPREAGPVPHRLQLTIPWP